MDVALGSMAPTPTAGAQKRRVEDAAHNATREAAGLRSSGGAVLLRLRTPGEARALQIQYSSNASALGTGTNPNATGFSVGFMVLATAGGADDVLAPARALAALVADDGGAALAVALAPGISALETAQGLPPGSVGAEYAPGTSAAILVDRVRLSWLSEWADYLYSYFPSAAVGGAAAAVFLLLCGLFFIARRRWLARSAGTDSAKVQPAPPRKEIGGLADVAGPRMETPPSRGTSRESKPATPISGRDLAEKRALERERQLARVAPAQTGGDEDGDDDARATRRAEKKARAARALDEMRPAQTGGDDDDGARALRRAEKKARAVRALNTARALDDMRVRELAATGRAAVDDEWVREYGGGGDIDSPPPSYSPRGEEASSPVLTVGTGRGFLPADAPFSLNEGAGEGAGAGARAGESVDGPFPGQIPDDDVDAIGRHAKSDPPSATAHAGTRGAVPALTKAGRSVLGKAAPAKSRAAAYGALPPSVASAAVVYGGPFTGPRGAAAALLGARAAGSAIKRSAGLGAGPIGAAAAAAAVQLAQRQRAGAVERARIKAEKKKGLNLTAAGKE